MPIIKSKQSPHFDIIQQMLKKRRIDAGLTQKDLAKSQGWPQSYISKIEARERRIDLLEFINLAEAIGFSAQDFITELQAKIKAASK